MVTVASSWRCAAAALVFASTVALAAGDLSRQEPIEVTVELGKPGQHAFAPSKLRFETGKLYKLVLRNPSNDPHYFTSHAFTQLIYTRKVQVVHTRDGKTVPLAEFKGAIREIEVYPGQTAEWWFVPAWWARSSSSEPRPSRTRGLGAVCRAPPLLCPKRLTHGISQHRRDRQPARRHRTERHR
jgi:uncharacterized cupredoxin-like copper-binding protein